MSDALNDVKMEFARRLQRAMIRMRYNQSELARRANHFAPEDRFIRDTISKYMRGKELPGPTRLEAIAKALDLSPAELLPAAPSMQTEFELKDLGRSDGQMLLSFKQYVSYDTAMKIMQLLKNE